MKFSQKVWLAFLVALLSAFVSACMAGDGFQLQSAVFCLPMIVLIFPLLGIALLLKSGSHRKTALGIFIAGMLTYLAYAIYTLGGELMTPLIGQVYIPVLLITLAFGIYALYDKRA